MGCAPVSALIGCCALVLSTTIGGYSAGRGSSFLSVGPWRACQARRWGRCNAPATCHPVTRGKIWRPMKKFWPCAGSCTRSSIPRPGVGRASRHAISPMPRNCSAYPRTPASRRSRANIPVPRKTAAHPAGLHRPGHAAAGKQPVAPSFFPYTYRTAACPLQPAVLIPSAPGEAGVAAAPNDRTARSASVLWPCCDPRRTVCR